MIRAIKSVFTTLYVMMPTLPWTLLFWLAAPLACAATLAGFWGHKWWLFELTSHFRAQYFLFFAAGTLFFLLSRRYKPAAFYSVFALINLALILPLYWGGAPAADPGHAVRALQLNVHGQNRAYDKVRALIEEAGPDLLVLEEVTPRWIKSLEDVWEQYPYQKIEAMRGYKGIALLSRIPFESSEIRYFGMGKHPSVVARLRLSGRPLTVIGTHPISPTNPRDSFYRNLQLQEMGRYVASLKGEVMVLGDLNTTSWSSFFRDFLRESGLRDSRRGFGIQASWPTRYPFLWVPIDHCLVSEGVLILDRKVGPHIGSDHYPVIVDFFLKPAPLPLPASISPPGSAAG